MLFLLIIYKIGGIFYLFQSIILIIELIKLYFYGISL